MKRACLFLPLAALIAFAAYLGWQRGRPSTGAGRLRDGGGDGVRVFVITLICCLLPFGAHAFGVGPDFTHNSYAIDGPQISACVDGVGQQFSPDFVKDAEAACSGLGFESCTHDGMPIAFSRLSAITCFALERDYWEWRLQRVVSHLSGEHAPAEHVAFHGRTAPELDALARTWRAYMETKCSYFTSEYGVGSQRGREGDIVKSDCTRQETARFALEMEFRLRAQCDGPRRVFYGTVCEFAK